MEIQPKPETRAYKERVYYSEDLALRICELIATGETLRSVAAMDDMPSTASIKIWMLRHPDFRKGFVEAMRIRAESTAEELLAIGDETLEMVQGIEDPSRVSAIVSAQKLRSDDRKWIAARMNQKLYGDRTQVDANVQGGLVLHTSVPRPARPSPEKVQ